MISCLSFLFAITLLGRYIFQAITRGRVLVLPVFGNFIDEVILVSLLSKSVLEELLLHLGLFFVRFLISLIESHFKLLLFLFWLGT